MKQLLISYSRQSGNPTMRRTKISYHAKTDISTTKGIRHQFYLRLIEQYYKQYQALHIINSINDEYFTQVIKQGQ